MSIASFEPDAGSTKKITVSSASQSVSLPTRAGRNQVRIFNNGTATVWVAIGAAGGSVTLANGMPIGPNQFTEVVSVTAPNSTALSAYAIAAAATGDIYFTVGGGL